MNRIDRRFAELKEKGQKGMVAYIGAGDPDLGATHDLAIALDGAGVDVLELGIPFTDPLADGVVNQLAAQRGLDSGTTPYGVLETVKKIRETSQIPIVLYIYYNLVHRRGLDEFVLKASEAGVDGLLALDLPYEEADRYEELMLQAEMRPIFLIAPTTPENRIHEIAKKGAGFLYYISREGVTGMQSSVSDTIAEMTALIRKHSQLPIAVGFGISNPDQAVEVSKNAESIVVGSAIVNRIAEFGKSDQMVEEVARFVKTLTSAIRPESQ